MKIKNEALRFGIGGIPGAILNLSIISFVPQNSMFFVVLLYTIAFFVREITSYFIHKNWTYKYKKNKTALVYSYTTLYLLLLNTIAYLFFTKTLGMNKFLSQMTVNILFFFINFFEVKKVFKNGS